MKEGQWNQQEDWFVAKSGGFEVALKGAEDCFVLSIKAGSKEDRSHFTDYMFNVMHNRGGYSEDQFYRDYSLVKSAFEVVRAKHTPSLVQR